MPLADDQIDRYSRQILLREIGARGQERLLASSVAIHGAGSLAHLCGLYLAGAGIGRIGLIDPSGSSSDALSEDLSALNPNVRIEQLPFPLAPRTSHLAPLHPFDALVDAGSNPSISTQLAAAQVPLLAGGAHGSQGWLTRHGGGCAACVVLHAAEIAPEQADLEPSPFGVVASLLAFETLASLLGWEEEGERSWLHYDGTDMSLKTVPFVAHPDCAACGGES